MNQKKVFVAELSDGITEEMLKTAIRKASGLGPAQMIRLAPGIPYYMMKDKHGEPFVGFFYKEPIAQKTDDYRNTVKFFKNVYVWNYCDGSGVVTGEFQSLKSFFRQSK